MITLIQATTYPRTKLNSYSPKDFLPEPIPIGDFRIKENPRAVLEAVLPTHFIDTYLGGRPWIVEVTDVLSSPKGLRVP